MWELIARRTLLASSVLLAAFLGYLLVRNADSLPTSQPISLAPLEQADAKLSDFIFTQSKGDVVQWQVQAKHARVFEQEKQALLYDVALTFYGGDGEEVTVHGEEGTLDTASKNFLLSNHEAPIIVTTRSGYTIYTNHLVWTDKTKEIRTEEPVRIVGQGLEIRGLGLLGRMESEEFEVLHDVHVDLVPAS
jgi:LPS export ABC transporter protein LptC